ncbi:hypothetical protein OIU78_007436 [Salix suchowensis]|nr:hypothetical protein OIU78_007436 [Salix suchowensis]
MINNNNNNNNNISSFCNNTRKKRIGIFFFLLSMVNFSLSQAICRFCEFFEGFFQVGIYIPVLFV